MTQQFKNENEVALDINDILKDYINLDTVNIEDEIIDIKFDNYKFPQNILREININTKLRDYIKKTPKYEQDANELETFRVFRKGFLRNKGIFYCEGIQFMNEFDLLQTGTFKYITNGAFNGRYCLPICLPNGYVFTWMTYDPNGRYKYMLPKALERPDINYFHQGQLLGNLESINEYPDSTRIYFCEGMFDAYRVNEQFNSPGIALLGSALGKEKLDMLRIIKKHTNKVFVYIPDIDTAGLKGSLIENDIWDEIMNFSKEFNTDAKDLDQYFRFKNKTS